MLTRLGRSIVACRIPAIRSQFGSQRQFATKRGSVRQSAHEFLRDKLPLLTSKTDTSTTVNSLGANKGAVLRSCISHERLNSQDCYFYYTEHAVVENVDVESMVATEEPVRHCLRL